MDPNLCLNFWASALKCKNYPMATALASEFTQWRERGGEAPLANFKGEMPCRILAILPRGRIVIEYFDGTRDTVPYEACQF